MEKEPTYSEIADQLDIAQDDLRVANERVYQPLYSLFPGHVQVNYLLIRADQRMEAHDKLVRDLRSIRMLTQKIILLQINSQRICQR